MIISIIALIVWLIPTVMYLSKPKGYDAPNWYVGIMGLIIVLGYLVDILEKLK